MKTIDFNSDVGESFGIYQLGQDAQILPQVSSANIACGFHSGDPATMRKTVALAKQHGIAVGAHPGLPDLQGFGRRNMAVTPAEAYDMVVYQVGALMGVALSQGLQLAHVKAHGALYNMAAKSAELSMAICQAVLDINPSLMLFGLANSELTRAAERLELPVAHEVFADRSYQDDGSLTPRGKEGAMITDVHQSIEQVLGMVLDGRVKSQQGNWVPVKADTLCIHGDQPGAAQFALQIRTALEKEGIVIQPCSGTTLRS
ncbi:LamB/YcsF family protein [Pokkaliibacter plantistimulans]|uniref:5-oxoprolinase subunit A n=1 Tax=Proteobacteria bacterium 228 TaxID=2083153 RepID=A0A2S5KPC5_9PROT|nr:5-oxoprolinase subunit PxpA [Pokkaliibacter plantistimulans]PPC76697.1 LamB/YcsF family protein [Pokkaliibacter plantistimulans]